MDRAIKITDALVAQVAETLRREEEPLIKAQNADSNRINAFQVGTIKIRTEQEVLMELPVRYDEDYWHREYGPIRATKELLMHVHRCVGENHLEVMVNHRGLELQTGQPHEQELVLACVGHEAGHILAGHFHTPEPPTFVLHNLTDTDRALIQNDADGHLGWLISARRVLEGGYLLREVDADRYGAGVMQMHAMLFLHSRGLADIENSACRLELYNRIVHHQTQLWVDPDYIPTHPATCTPWAHIPLEDIQLEISLAPADVVRDAIAEYKRK